MLTIRENYKIKYAFHDIDGTHSLIRDWPPVMSICLYDVILNNWNDEDIFYKKENGEGYQANTIQSIVDDNLINEKAVTLVNRFKTKYGKIFFLKYICMYSMFFSAVFRYFLFLRSPYALKIP